MGETPQASIDDRIKNAALRLFNHRGYGAATVGQIAREAGVGIGTVYRRWPDKPALANEVYAHVLDRIESFEVRPVRGRSRKAKFVKLLRSFTDFASAEPQMLLFLVGQPHEAYLDARNRQRQAKKDAEVLELITQLRLTATPELAAAMSMGTIAQCVRAGVDVDAEDLAERLWLALSK